jgi:predicted acyltransferase
VAFKIAFWWNLGFPINKKLWTSSFVMHTTGLDCMILACIIYWLDFRHKKTVVYFFQVFGRNPLVIYIFSDVFALILYLIPIDGKPLFMWAYPHFFSHAGPQVGSLLFATTYMLICWCFGYILDKRKIYIRI